MRGRQIHLLGDGELLAVGGFKGSASAALSRDQRHLPEMISIGEQKVQVFLKRADRLDNYPVAAGCPQQQPQGLEAGEGNSWKRIKENHKQNLAYSHNTTF